MATLRVYKGSTDPRKSVVVGREEKDWKGTFDDLAQLVQEAYKAYVEKRSDTPDIYVEVVSDDESVRVLYDCLCPSNSMKRTPIFKAVTPQR